MTRPQINSACLSILNISYYGCPMRDTGRSLKYKTQSLIQADRFFDFCESRSSRKGESQ